MDFYTTVQHTPAWVLILGLVMLCILSCIFFSMRNLTLDQYLDLLLNLHGLYDKIDNLSSRLEAAESELDAIKNDVGHGE